MTPSPLQHSESLPAKMCTTYHLSCDLSSWTRKSKPVVATVQILSDTSNFRELKKTINSQDEQCLVEEACKHQSVNLASSINWPRVWEAARDRGPYWSYIAQSFYRAITRPLFGDRSCVTCGSHIPESVSSFQHLTETHAPNTLNVPNLLADLSSDSEPVSTSFHCMKSLVFLSKPTE